MVDGKWQMVVLVRSRMRTRTVLAAVRGPRRQTGLARKHQRNAAVCSAITGHFRLPREKNRLQAAKVSHRARACAASHGPPGPCTLLGPGSYLRSGASDLTTPFAGGIGSYFHTPGLGLFVDYTRRNFSSRSRLLETSSFFLPLSTASSTRDVHRDPLIRLCRFLTRPTGLLIGGCRVSATALPLSRCFSFETRQFFVLAFSCGSRVYPPPMFSCCVVRFISRFSLVVRQSPLRCQRNLVLARAVLPLACKSPSASAVVSLESEFSPVSD